MLLCSYEGGVVMSIYERLVQERKKAGLTQKEISDKLGISYQSYAQYERGVRNPKYETIRRFADAIGCKITDLLTTQEETDLLIDRFLDSTPKKQDKGPFFSSYYDEDTAMDFADAVDEQKTPGIHIKRFTDFISENPLFVLFMRKQGISLEIINWHEVRISTSEDYADVRISELLIDLNSFCDAMQENIRKVFKENYGLVFAETDQPSESKWSALLSEIDDKEE